MFPDEDDDFEGIDKMSLRAYLALAAFGIGLLAVLFFAGIYATPPGAELEASDGSSSLASLLAPSDILPIRGARIAGPAAL